MFVNEVCKVGLDMKDVACDTNLIENMVNDLMGHRKEEFLNSAWEVAMFSNHSVRSFFLLQFRLFDPLHKINKSKA